MAPELTCKGISISTPSRRTQPKIDLHPSSLAYLNFFMGHSERIGTSKSASILTSEAILQILLVRSCTSVLESMYKMTRVIGLPNWMISPFTISRALDAAYSSANCLVWRTCGCWFGMWLRLLDDPSSKWRAWAV